MHDEMMKKILLFGGISGVLMGAPEINRDYLLTPTENFQLGCVLGEFLNFSDDHAKKLAIELYQELGREVIRLGFSEAKNE